MLASTMRRPHLCISLFRGARARKASQSSALQQPSEVFVNDKRDTGAREHPDHIRGQAAIKASHAFVCPGVRDCGWDGTMMGACEHRVVLLTFVSCVSAFHVREMG